ncbi:uncharacterized protein K452DRAFT_227027 [Aplosporella prunicola CBS 121167]|uniref:MYG1 protein n=1 Tax=Aplosporella prunicola CBS 121167 TaxID=1176127 RepID=A0A6A6BGW2_9PEZI|nr:uncharacterized protein K452DRAFT_227027 [Aplosporella prunicola CBS 121167]KAF2142663.1 hypothetical protein K452DRAFT_227027 [Aplosporella prunicola CBS 121167]
MSQEPQAKRLKMSGNAIGTHNGHFHADEALAVYLLRTLPRYASSPLIRTRDPALLETCHTVVDVGGVYDDAKNRYDHHQREFNEFFPGRSATKLSSAGLVYKHFGKEIIAQQTGLAIDSEDAEILYQKLYDNIIEAFDANDNGVSTYDHAALKEAGYEKRFENRGFSIASVVNRYNFNFDKEADATKTKEQLQSEEDERFLKASGFVGEQFILELTDKHRSWLPARTLVKGAFDERKQYDPKGRIMVLKTGMPWMDHLYTLEAESNTAAENQVLYVLFPENDEPDSKWRIRSVSVEGAGFTNRKDLPDAWKGMRDEALDQVSGIPGGVFIHASGFIGGNKTYDGALKMAQKALEL